MKREVHNQPKVSSPKQENHNHSEKEKKMETMIRRNILLDVNGFLKTRLKSIKRKELK